jgi:hypothetical protein
VDHGEYVRYQEGAGEPRKHAQHGGSLGQFEIQSLTLSPTQSPGPICL